MANPNADADALASDMPCAKVVETENGDGLLIAGRVYMVTGPGGNAAGLFARAMRRSTSEVSPVGLGLSSGSVARMAKGGSAGLA